MRSLDFTLFHAINAGLGTPRGWVDFGVGVSEWLPGAFMLALALGALWRPAWRRPLLVALLSLALAWLTVTAFRHALPMPRPAALGLGVQWVGQGARPSFPSMHVTGVAAVAWSLLISRCGWPALVAACVGVLVGWSRIFLGLHFPSDVLGGVAVGLLVASAAAQMVRMARRVSTGLARGGSAAPDAPARALSAE